MNKLSKKLSLFSLCALASVAISAVGAAAFIQPQTGNDTYAWSDTTPSVSDSYYASCQGKVGQSLKSALKSFNHPQHKGYDWEIKTADEMKNDSSSVLCLYTRLPFSKSNQDRGGGNSRGIWNREHIVPQSKCKDSKTDRHNYYACEKLINATRGNLPYGIVNNGSTPESFEKNDCKIGGGYFEPCDEAKGEVARAAMYVVLEYNVNIHDVFSSFDLMVQWNIDHPVTDREIHRNNEIYKIQNNRNPFIDHPEYGNAIWGDQTLPEKPEVPDTSTSTEEVPPVEPSTETPNPSTSTEVVPPENDALKEYANLFMEKVVCDGKGEVAPSAEGWKEAGKAFAKLDSESKETLKTADYKDPVVGKVVERYDYVISKYGVENYQNFMVREIVEDTNTAPIAPMSTNSQLLTAIIVGVGIISVSIIGAIYVVVRKRSSSK